MAPAAQPQAASSGWQARLMQSGSFWMIMASILFATMGMFVKLGSAEFTTPELVFYRCVVALIVVGGVVMLRGGSLATPVPGRQMSRGVAGTISLMMYFYAIGHLPLGTAVTFNYTSPLFLALLTTLWLKEKVTGRMLFSIALGFVGVAILLRPTFAREQWFAGVVALGSGFLSGVAYMNVRMLGAAGEPDWRTVFYFSLIATLAGGVWMLFGRFNPITLHNVWILLGMGGCATAAQLAMTRAYRKGASLVVASLSYVTVIISSLYGMLFWQDSHPPSAWLAILLIIASGVVTATRR